MPVKLSLLILGIAIVLVLAGVAIYYLIALRKQQMRQERERQAKSEQRAKTRKSIELLVQFAEQGQVEATEAAIRISVLMSSLAYSSENSPAFTPFFALADASSHIPILDRWRALDKASKKRLTAERLRLEALYEKELASAYAAVRAHPDFFKN